MNSLLGDLIKLDLTKFSKKGMQEENKISPEVRFPRQKKSHFENKRYSQEDIEEPAEVYLQESGMNKQFQMSPDMCYANRVIRNNERGLPMNSPVHPSS